MLLNPLILLNCIYHCIATSSADFITPLPQNLAPFDSESRTVSLFSLVAHNDTGKSKKLIDDVFGEITKGKTFTATEMVIFVTSQQDAWKKELTKAKLPISPAAGPSESEVELASTQLIQSIRGYIYAEVDKDQFQNFMNDTIHSEFPIYPQVCQEMQSLFQTCRSKAKTSTDKALQYNSRKFSPSSIRQYRVNAIIYGCNSGWSAVGGWKIEECALRNHEKVLQRPTNADDCNAMFYCFMSPDQQAAFDKKFPNNTQKAAIDFQTQEITPMELAERSLLAAFLQAYAKGQIMTLIGAFVGTVLGISLVYFIGAFLFFPAYAAGSALFLHSIGVGMLANLVFPEFIVQWIATENYAIESADTPN